MRGTAGVTYTFGAVNRPNRLLAAGLILWGAALALWLGRVYFLHPAERSHENHERNTYAGRLIEFRDLLARGDLSPQWCGHFRGGLGSPYFGYYQPGFFYAAGLVPWQVPPVRALGAAVAAFAMLGYLGMLGLVGRRFGTLSGWLAATALLTSVYAGTEIYVRGDLSELAAMMTLPAALWALAGWLEQGRVRHAVCLALAGGALIVLHPIVALLGYGLMGLAVGVFALMGLAKGLPLPEGEGNCWRRAAGAVAALGAGIGLAAFYWMPVFFELDLVQSDRAFVGFYHYASHFVDPRDLFGLYSRTGTIPLALGVLPLLLAALNAAVLIARWGEATPPQRRLLLFALGAAALYVLLMTRASAPVWDWCPPLQRLQFPWRILSVVAVLVAAAAGAMLPWTTDRIGGGRVALLVLALATLSWMYTAYQLDPDARVPEGTGPLAAQDFAPDLRDEWLPRGATRDIPLADRRGPTAGPGCRVEDFQRGQGRLSGHVRANRPSWIILPHYHFPVGWRAELDGLPVPLGSDPRGLMRIDLPEGTDAMLEIGFSRTPMRRWGLIVSASTLLVGIGLTVAVARRRPIPGAGDP